MRAALLSLLGAVLRGAPGDNLERLLLRKACDRIFAGARHPRYHAQHAQDLFLDHLVFHGRRGGVFVDIGAHDGEALSNTCYFERELGWSGLCVEPNPAVFGRLRANRRCACLNCGISDRAGTLAFLQLPGELEMGSGFVEHYDPRSAFAARPPPGARRLEVPVRRLMDVLAEHGMRRVDYLSIDTEGADFAILRSIDFSACDIAAVSVENGGCEERMATFMKARGYRLAAVLGADDIFVRA